MASVLLLGPQTMPQVAAWRSVLASVAGSCTLATLHPAPATPEESRHVVDLRDGRPFAAAFARAVGALRTLDARSPFDVVLAYYVTSYGSLAALAFPRRFVAVAAGSDIDPTRLRLLRRTIARFALARAGRAVAWTPIMAERMNELGFPPDRTRTGPRGIDLDVYRPPDGPPVDDGTIRVLTTRRLRPVFRHDVLLRAVRSLADRGVACRAELVGSGSERDRLVALAKELGVDDRVHFPGALPAEVVAERLRSAAVFVTLSTKDGLSTSLVEALACGTVPVVSDIAPNRELVRHRANGIVVRGDDPEEVADAIVLAARDRGFRDAAIRANLETTRGRFDVRRNSAAILAFAGVGDLAREPFPPEIGGVIRDRERP